MVKRIKILTTFEQILTLDSNGNSTITSNKIINTTIVDDNNKVLNPVQFQFGPSQVKYGYFNLTKTNPFRSLYSPGSSVNISVNGITEQGKWHLEQVRIDGLTKLFSKFKDLTAKVFNLGFDPMSNTFVFEEI